MRIPGFEKIKSVAAWGDSANKNGFQIELTEQRTDTPPRNTQTSDNVTVRANASVYWRIADPRKALYEIDDLPRAVADVALNALRSNIGRMTLDSLLSERQAINERIAAELAETALKWGIQFTRVEIQQLDTDDETSRAMRQQMDAERKKRAFISESEGQADAMVKVAESEKKASILIAEGRAKALEITAAAETAYLIKLRETKIAPELAAQILIAQKYIDGFGVITKNPADKVFLPNDFNGLFSIPAAAAKPSQVNLPPNP